MKDRQNIAIKTQIKIVLMLVTVNTCMAAKKINIKLIGAFSVQYKRNANQHCFPLPYTRFYKKKKRIDTVVAIHIIIILGRVSFMM